MAGTNKKYPKNLQSFLTDFDHKRRSVRENSLTSLINALNSNPRHKFVEENYITLCHTCLTRLTSKKKGSNTYSKLEIRLAIRVISMLGVHIVNQDYAHQVFDESVPVLSDALVRFVCEVDVVMEVLVCLGVVGFFCSSDSMEVERVRWVVWEFMVQGGGGGGGGGDERLSLVLGAGIRSWTFLLSGLRREHLSKKLWEKSISFFSSLMTQNRPTEVATEEGKMCAALSLEDREVDSESLLERKDCHDDCVDHVVLGARNALSLIYEFDSIEIFSDECNKRVDLDHSLLQKESGREIEGSTSTSSTENNETKNNKPELPHHNNVDSRSSVAKNRTKDNNAVWSHRNKAGNLSHTIQVKFLKLFLGKEGFGCHMKENENFHRLFESVSSKKGKKAVDVTVPEREEVVVKFYRREVQRREDDIHDLLPYVSEKEKKVQYRMGKSPSSSLNKARTQLLTKQRKVVNPDFVESEFFD